MPESLLDAAAKARNTLAEDVVPEALARAPDLAVLRRAGKNPAAWIMRTSRNLALDVVRRVSKWRYGGGRACEVKLALGIEGETSDRPRRVKYRLSVGHRASSCAARSGWRASVRVLTDPYS